MGLGLGPMQGWVMLVRVMDDAAPEAAAAAAAAPAAAEGGGAPAGDAVADGGGVGAVGGGVVGRELEELVYMVVRPMPLPAPPDAAVAAVRASNTWCRSAAVERRALLTGPGSPRATWGY
jgi:hypothetical protein